MITVYRSVIQLDSTDVYQAHRSVMARFPTLDVTSPRAEMQVLWRDVGDHMAIVQSTHDWGAADEVRVRFADGQRVTLSAVVAPLKRDRHSGRMVRVADELVEEWMRSRLVGLEVNRVNVGSYDHLRGRKATHWIEYPTVNLLASGTVRDASALERVCVEGIGKGRAFGLGLVIQETTHAHR